MTDQDRDDADFSRRMKVLLDHGVETLPEEITRQLYHRRQQALNTAVRTANAGRPRALPWGGVAAAALALVIGVSWWVMQPAPLPRDAGLDAFDLLVAQEELEFYEDLEFYQWLADVNPSG